MLFVTVTDASSRSTRSRYETTDPREAASQALAKFLAAEPTQDATVLSVLIEREGTQLSKGDLAERIEEMRTAEVERARQ